MQPAYKLHVLKQTLREHLGQSYSDGELRQWFDPLKVDMREDERCVHIGFPHCFFAQWFAREIQDAFESQLHGFFGQGYVVRYVNSVCASENGPAPARQTKAIDFPFGHQFSFETFITNKKNYFPLATAREVAKNTDVVFNPFIINGDNGSGKTHLIKAIANEVTKKYDPESIFFGSLEDLYNLYDVQFKDPFAARKHVERFDMIFVDEFQSIRRFRSFQPELVNIFNHFYDNKKQMVFSGSDKLAGYDFLDPKLKSRLEWGLIVSLKSPDLDVRIRYIERNCKAKKIRLTKEQILNLAQRFSDLRFLQGILLKIYAFREFVHKEVTDQDFQQIISQTAGGEKRSIKPDVILDAVAEHFEVPKKDILGTKRHHRIVRARQVAMFLCRELIGSSYPSLGRMFGGRDHSTALYAIKKINTLQDSSREMKNLVTALKKKCLARGEQ